MAHQKNQGVSRYRLAPFPLECEGIVKLTTQVGKHIVIGTEKFILKGAMLFPLWGGEIGLFPI